MRHTENKKKLYALFFVVVVFLQINPLALVIPIVKTLLLNTAIQLPITQMLHLI